MTPTANHSCFNSDWADGSRTGMMEQIDRVVQVQLQPQPHRTKRYLCWPHTGGDITEDRSGFESLSNPGKGCLYVGGCW